MNRTIAFLLSILFILTSCGVYMFISHSSRFCVTQIEIKGNHKASEKEILKRANIQLGTNIIRMDLGEIEDRIQEDKRIKEVCARRRLPNRLLIEVEEKQPVLWLNLPEGLYGLSQDREIIPLEEGDFGRDLAIVSGLSSATVAGKRSQSLVPYKQWPNVKAKFALKFCDAVWQVDSTLGEVISEINLQSENNLVLYLIPRAIRVDMGKGSLETKLKRLKTILSHEEKTDQLTSIDLRFKDQVVLRRSSPGLLLSGSQNRGEQSNQTGLKGSGGKESL